MQEGYCVSPVASFLLSLQADKRAKMIFCTRTSLPCAANFLLACISCGSLFSWMPSASLHAQPPIHPQQTEKCTIFVLVVLIMGVDCGFFINYFTLRGAFCIFLGVRISARVLGQQFHALHLDLDLHLHFHFHLHLHLHLHLHVHHHHHHHHHHHPHPHHPHFWNPGSGKPSSHFSHGKFENKILAAGINWRLV